MDIFCDPPNPAETRLNSLKNTMAEMATNDKLRSRWKEIKPKSTAPAKPNFNTRTREYFHAKGFLLYRSESFNSYSMRKNDLMGFADAIALKRGESAIAVQITSKSNISARRNKIKALQAAEVWLATGNRILILGWFKLDNGRWQAVEEWIVL